MESKLTYVSLAEITLKIGSGATPKGGDESYKESGISLIRSLNIYDFVFRYKNLAFIDDNQAAKLKNVAVVSDDILLNITGASVGRCCIVPDDVLPARVNQHVAIIRINKSVAVPQYIYYVINSGTYKNALLNLSETGATREALTKDDISHFKIPFPSLSEQQQIAEILSTYDDLIETNNQRIATLEQLAQQIYKEWFVRMRFPGWETTPFHYGIPDGWEEIQFSELVNILSGGTPSTTVTNYWNGDILFFTPKDANPNCIYVSDSDKKTTEQGLENCNSSLYEPNTVFITARGSVGKVNLNVYPMAMNQSCFALRGKNEIPQTYLFFATKASVETMKFIANGATFDAITIDSFSRFKVLKPTSELIRKFDEIVTPFFNEISCIMEMNTYLTKTRNLLLPRLISGKLTIKQAEALAP